MDIVVFEGGPGWQPITYMAALAADLLNARLTVVSNPKPGQNLRGRLAMLRPRKRGSEDCLFILPAPASLYSCPTIEDWKGRYRRVSAWIIDSFWEEWIPRLTRYTSNFDHFYVTNPEDVEPWRRISGTTTSVLTWGTDALRLGSSSGNRNTDLIRVGRQPREWQDDQVAGERATEFGIRFRGRPRMADDPKDNQQFLMQAFADSRFTLCFSNTVDGFGYTHKRREYVTARWMDALASGTVVAGISPRCEVVRELFWPGALLELGTAEQEGGFGVIREALQSWSPVIAAKNHIFALERLDWRWRFKQIADDFDIACPKLEADLHEIRKITSAIAP